MWIGKLQETWARKVPGDNSKASKSHAHERDVRMNGRALEQRIGNITIINMKYLFIYFCHKDNTAHIQFNTAFVISTYHWKGILCMIA